MKEDSSLDYFVDKYININKDRLKKAKSKVNSTDGTLIDFLRKKVPEFQWSVYQGSFWYHAIIKPKKDEDDWEYDVDLAVKLKYNEDFKWNEKEYHNLLIKVFEDSETYKNKLDLEKERSIRIRYDSNDWEFYVDIVPTYYDWEKSYIVDRINNNPEISWWTEFKERVNEQNNNTQVDWSNEKFLKIIIRIMKYLKRKNSIDIKSVQLTLLLARQIEKINDKNIFKSLSETFYNILSNLKLELDWYLLRTDLDLSNPWLPEEKFDRWIDEYKFSIFKNWIKNIFSKVEEAYNADEEDSIDKWKEIFWDDFAKEQKINKITMISLYPHAELIDHYNWTRTHYTEEFELIAERAPLYNGIFSDYISNNRCPKNSLLRFWVKLPEYNDWTQIIRQVTNINNSYVPEKSRRWEMNKPRKDLWYDYRKWAYWIEESTRWKWRHWIKCYIVKDNIIIKESKPFYVVV